MEIREVNTRKKNNFVLTKVLAVVAIIGILVCIFSPFFADQAEKLREIADLINVRSAYAELVQDIVTENTGADTYNAAIKRYSKTVPLRQKQIGWAIRHPAVAGITPEDKEHWVGQVLGEGSCTILYDADKERVTLLWSDISVKSNYQWVKSDGKLHLSSSLSSTAWPASSIPNAFDAKANVGQNLVLKQLTAFNSPNLWKSNLDGYHFEVAFFLIDDDSNILVDHGYEVLSTKKDKECTISTKEADLSQESGSTDKKVYKELSDGDSCKVAIQVYRVNDSRNSCVALSDAEAAEITNLIDVSQLQ